MKIKLTFCMPKPRILPLLFLFCTGSVAVCTVAHAVPTREITVGTRWPQLVATNGKVFRNVKFTFVSPREVRFMHTDGIGSLPLGEVVMPDDVSMPMPGAGDSRMPPELTMGPLGSMMTSQERKVSGIDKLSNDEQATLAKWVVGTVEDRLKEELQRRGLPPTFAPLETVAAVSGLQAGEQVSAAAAAPVSSPNTNSAVGSVALSSPPALMAAAPGRTYVPPTKSAPVSPSASSPLLPPPAPALAPVDVAAPSPVSSPPAPPLPVATPNTISRGVDPVGIAAVDAASKMVSTGAAPTRSKPAATRTEAKLGNARIGVVESSIAGEFRGLETGRQFRLVNGQTWQQQEPVIHDHMAFKPRVTIYPSHSGDGWMMAVDGVDKTVRVAPVN